MELERIESSWYADGLEAVLELYFRFDAEPRPLLVEVVRPCCERFTHPPQDPAPGEPLTCILPRECFENAETVTILVKRVERGAEVVLWEGTALAREIEGEPNVQVFRDEQATRPAAA